MAAPMDEFASLPQHDSQKGTISHSKHIPRWIWLITAKSLGVKTHSKDKPWLGYIFYFLTILFGGCYVIATAVYTYFDVKSKDTKFDALNGFIIVIMSFGFFFIGLYANKLGHKLFSNRTFLYSLRLHSRTVLRISAPILTGVIGFGFLLLYEYEKFTSNQNSSKPCDNLKLWPYICHIRYVSQIAFACIAYLWNLLVSIACFSLCRTHTISIRHFLLELDEDALVYIIQRKKSPRIQAQDFSDTIDGRSTAENCNDRSPLLPGINCINADKRSHSDTNLYNSVKEVMDVAWEEELFKKRVRSVSELYQSAIRRPSTTSINQPEYLTITGQSQLVGDDLPDWPHLSTAASGITGYSTAPASKMMEVNDILDKFWKLQCQLMTTSLAIQRWLASWIILILFWSMVYLIYWISHEALIIDMFLFFVPLILLPLLCSGPTEVNGEGQRVPKDVGTHMFALTNQRRKKNSLIVEKLTIETPFNPFAQRERLEVIGYVSNAPLAVTIYGYALNHSSVVTAIVAVALAFATKIIVTNV